MAKYRLDDLLVRRGFCEEKIRLKHGSWRGSLLGITELTKQVLPSQTIRIRLRPRKT